MSSAATSPAASPRQGNFHRFWRTLKQLFLELVGAMFAVLGLAWLNLALRSLNRDVAHWLIAIAIAVALLFFFFALSSFRRSRKL
jgi:predicted small integral membrane protein